MVTVSRGDIFLCDLNPVIGTEQSGIRPVIVVQIDKANVSSPHTIILPLTTKIRSAILPSHVEIKAGITNLQQDSVVLCEQIRVIDKIRLLKRIGNLNQEIILKVNKAISIILGLN